MPSQHTTPTRWMMFAAAGVVTAVCVLILEVGVRFAGLAPPLDVAAYAYVADPHLPYKPAPRSRVTGRSPTGEFEFDYAHNSLGFRDSEHALAKPAGSFRIVAVGDSFTYGAAAPFAQTYLVRLEAMLNARGAPHPPVEIVKLGISRYFPESERLVLEHYGLKYSPDLIVVGFVPNDVMDTALGIDAIQTDAAGRLRTRESKELGSVGMFLFEHSHVFRIVLSRYVASRLQRGAPIRREEIYRAGGFHEKDWRRIEEEFGRMRDAANRAGAKLAIIYIPMLEAWAPHHAYPSDRLAIWSAANGAYFIDTLPPLRAASLAGASVYYVRDGHCTPEGYAIIARTVAAELSRLKLVP
jgi:hypothetical protein